jgi:hypothetical protein
MAFGLWPIRMAFGLWPIRMAFGLWPIRMAFRLDDIGPGGDGGVRDGTSGGDKGVDRRELT